MSVEKVIVPEVGEFAPIYVGTGTRVVGLPGQWAANKEGELLAPGDVVEQTRAAYRNLASALAGIGADFSNLISVSHYIVDMKHDDIEGIYLAGVDVAQELGQSDPPVAPNYGVTALGQPGFLVELTAVAVLP